MSSDTLKDWVRNKYIWDKLEVAPMNDTMRETCLRWFSHAHKESHKCNNEEKW